MAVAKHPLDDLLEELADLPTASNTVGRLTTHSAATTSSHAANPSPQVQQIAVNITTRCCRASAMHSR
jgi:hypothetical protein